MNINVVKINFIVLILVVVSHGGVIEGVYGRIKNTTTGLTQDVKNVWSYSKGLVGQGDPPTGEQREEERGLIGGMIHSATSRAHALYEFWTVEEIPNDSGLLWNMYCRMKQRLAKATNYILGNGEKPIEDTPPNAETQIIKDTMETLFNTDGTRKIEGEAFIEAVEDLRKKLNEIRKNSTTTKSPVHYGEGLIDVRLADVQNDFKDNAADAVGVANDVYDKVYDNMDTVNDKINKNTNSGIEIIKADLNKVQGGVIGLKDKVSDAAEKEKDILDNSYNKLNQDAMNFADNIKKPTEELTRIAYP